MPNTLDTLPLELLDMILSNITSQKDLKQVCEVCIRLWDCAIPHLYRCLVLTTPDPSCNELTDAVNSIPKRYVRHIRDFELRIPIFERECSHCKHRDNVWVGEEDAFFAKGLHRFFEGIEDEATGGKIRDEVCAFHTLMHALYDLHFLDNQLRSFRWNIGMCIPNILLCTNEISLLRKQRNIESLTLHTEFNCSLGVGSSSVDLAHFPKLRSLSWKGLNKYSDFECLKDWIRVHGHRIVSLTLDLVSWHRAKKIWTDGLRQQSDKKEIDNFLTHSVLSAKAEDERIMFQALEYLDLSAISFEHADTEMPLVFRIENLKTLKLRK
ncbi:hypothetical protein AtubIFM55763_007569, partial [Aspergillus tubingensis]